MDELDRIELCLSECKKIINEIESEVTSYRPIGKTYDAYVELRKKQLIKLETIYKQLSRLQKKL